MPSCGETKQILARMRGQTKTTNTHHIDMRRTTTKILYKKTINKNVNKKNYYEEI